MDSRISADICYRVYEHIYISYFLTDTSEYIMGSMNMSTGDYSERTEIIQYCYSPAGAESRGKAYVQ